MRPGRVEVYRKWAPERAARPCPTGRDCPGCKECVYELAWRFLAANGRRESQSARTYRHTRDLARSLELAFPGYRLLDQNGCLTGPDWFLWGLEANWRDDDGSAYLSLPPGLVLGMGMRGVRIPVVSPVNLTSRR